MTWVGAGDGGMVTTRMFPPSEQRVRLWDDHLATATSELLKYDDRVRGLAVEGPGSTAAWPT
nr:hypothetical protein GCM10020241_54810 [Streptoalloteichus tenebrarius]